MARPRSSPPTLRALSWTHEEDKVKNDAILLAAPWPPDLDSYQFQSMNRVPRTRSAIAVTAMLIATANRVPCLVI